MNKFIAKAYTRLFMRHWSILRLLDIAFLSALLLIPIVWIANPLKLIIGSMHFTVGWRLKPVLAPVGLLALRTGIKQWGMRMSISGAGWWEKPRFRKIVFSLVMTYFFFAAMETTIGMMNFKVDFSPIIFQGSPKEEIERPPETIPDPELLWKFQPGSIFIREKINSLGFRDREMDLQKATGTMRVICMGDSVTAQGRPGYPQYLHDLLNRKLPSPHNWEAINLGVYGYSSVQGERLFQKIGKGLKPDFVTIFYGWNDHWLHSRTDRLSIATEMKPWQASLIASLRKKRFYQFFVWVLNPLQRLRPQADKEVFRVPPEDYSKTLEAMVSQIRLAGAVPILLTAPRSKLQDYLQKRNFARSVEEAEKSHDQYVEITRAVAKKTGVDLLDLAYIYRAPEYQKYFAPDGIHLDFYPWEGSMNEYPPYQPGFQPGLRNIAELLYRKISEITQREDWKAKHPLLPSS